MKGLSRKQRELLDYIEQYITDHQFSPSYHDIMKHFSYSSPGTVYKHLQTLKRKGVLLNEPGKARSCLPSRYAHQSHQETSDVALTGFLRLNHPIEIHQDHKKVTITTDLLRGAQAPYAFNLIGEEWTEEYLCDGDLLLIDSDAPPHEGETIIATNQQKSVLIKKLNHVDDYLQLSSRNPNIQPLILRPDDLNILGVVLATIRRY